MLNLEKIFEFLRNFDIVIYEVVFNLEIESLNKNKLDFDLDTLEDEIYKILGDNNKYDLKVIDKKIIVDYIKKVDDNFLYISVNFMGNNGYYFYKYNDIIVVNEYGVVIKDITTDFLKTLNY